MTPAQGIIERKQENIEGLRDKISKLRAKRENGDISDEDFMAQGFNIEKEILRNKKTIDNVIAEFGLAEPKQSVEEKHGFTFED